MNLSLVGLVLALWCNSLLAAPPDCPRLVANAFYTGPYVGAENALSPEDFYQDYTCSSLFKNQKFPAGFVTIFGSSQIVEKNTKGTPEAIEANNRLYADVKAFAYEWSVRHGSKFPILTGAGPGLMEAGSRGAKEANGHSIGYTTYYFQNDPAKAFQKYNGQDIITDGLIFTSVTVRESEMIRHSAAILIAPGGTGTTWEIFQTLETLKSKELIAVPVFLVGSSYFYWQRFSDLLKDMEARGTIDRDSVLKNVRMVDKAVDAIQILEQDLKLSSPP